MKKAARTKEYILEKVRPIFNKNGYSATSLSDITKATGLTKGAIYGNFKNKEDLALASFNYNVNFVLSKIKNITNTIESPLAKLYAITNFYREYYLHNIGFGGCPILNAGVDTNYNNSLLFKQVKTVYTKLKLGISKIIEEGQNINEMNKTIDAELYGSRILSQIEGAVFTSIMFKDDKYLIDMMQHLDNMITNELKK